MIDQNFINNSILILILMLLANYLSNGSILNIITKYYELLKTYLFGQIENFRGIFSSSGDRLLLSGIQECAYTTTDVMHDNEFKYVYNANSNPKHKINPHKETKDMKSLYMFLQSLVTNNKNFYELTPSRKTENTMSQLEIDLIRKHLIKSFKCTNFKFSNIQILDKLVYFKNPRGKEVKPFKISVDAMFEDISIGKLVLYLEMFIRLDDLYDGPSRSGLPTFTRIKLIHRGPQETPLPNEIVESDEYETPKDSENSLIPDSIHFSTDILPDRKHYYEDSENESMNHYYQANDKDGRRGVKSDSRGNSKKVNQKDSVYNYKSDNKDYYGKVKSDPNSKRLKTQLNDSDDYNFEKFDNDNSSITIPDIETTSEIITTNDQ
jgi:hypothetical protein